MIYILDLIVVSDDRESDILSWVSETPYEKHFKTAKDGLLPDSGRWLFEKQEFSNWLQSNKSELFWLRGKRKNCHSCPSYSFEELANKHPAGSGKTKLW